MTSVKGRRWPADTPFGTVNAAGNRPWVRADGFVCEARPGDFKFMVDADGVSEETKTKVDAMMMRCPRTGRFCGEIIVGIGKKPDISPSWLWDGNLDHPTLTPSINCTGGCGWHGHLRKGDFIEA